MSDNAPNSAPGSGVPSGGASGASQGPNVHESRRANVSESRSRGEGRQRGGRGGRDRGRGGGGRGGGGRGRGSGRGRGNDRPKNERNKSKGEMGRNEWSRTTVDKRKRIEEDGENKRRKLEEGGEPSLVGITYSAEEIAAEDRKPKRKVAVMIGYAGTGYKGMQLNDKEKTIEGDLFNAFVKAGAISKANADDPKKSSLVRCARTDKGVHAAGNVVSLKLIVEDPDVVKKINDNLPPQIRVWGYERTNASFSCYQTCDSRWYEYLIPTYSFLPPHPQSYLAKKIVESAEKEGVYETYQARQEEVSSFWEQTEKEYIEPILGKLEPEMRFAVLEAINAASVDPETGKAPKKQSEAATVPETTAEDKPTPEVNVANMELEPTTDDAEPVSSDVKVEHGEKGENATEVTTVEVDTVEKKAPRVPTPLEAAIAEVKNAYIAAKKAYRIAPARRARVQEALNKYLGTRNYHNYTIQKGFKDPSAKRVIRSFNVGQPIIINNTEWMSLKVHGQSFMMHQIRKMVAMAALVVRCGCDLTRIDESYGPENISIPKAPSLGLLLERPVFDSYNERAVRDLEKEKIDFGKYETEMEAFKQKEIYERLFEVEDKENQYHVFFHHVDNFKTDYFLYLTAEGIPATRQAKNGGTKRIQDDSEDEGGFGNEEG